MKPASVFEYEKVARKSLCETPPSILLSIFDCAEIPDHQNSFPGTYSNFRLSFAGNRGFPALMQHGGPDITAFPIASEGRSITHMMRACAAGTAKVAGAASDIGTASDIGAASDIGSFLEGFGTYSVWYNAPPRR